MSEFQNHEALDMLLEQNQFDACRMVAERMIEGLMALPVVEADLPADAMLKRWQERDLELAHLHLTLSRCLVGLHEFETAATMADAAALLARKAGDHGLLAETLHIAGVCYSQTGNYRLAVQSLTRCLDHATEVLRVKALFNRGHAYERMSTFKYAAADYEAGAQLADGLNENLARRCRINLAWMLILLKDFGRAQAVLTLLSSGAGAESDLLLQVQIAHDRLHMDSLKGEHKEALRGAFMALKQCKDTYPHVKAQIALTLMTMSSDHGLLEQAFTVGLLAKRLAGQAKRPELDAEASQRIKALEIEAGTELLAQSMCKTQQVAPSAVSHKRSAKRGQRVGGVE